MIINGKALLKAAPIKGMLTEKCKDHGVSHGLTEAGYDIRIKQDISFGPSFLFIDQTFHEGSFVIASSIEEFEMPPDLIGQVCDKSSWARQGLSVFNTVIEPGWRGFLTLELVYYGQKRLHIPAGSGIAQVLFSEVIHPTAYEGKYQDQDDRPVAAIRS